MPSLTLNLHNPHDLTLVLLLLSTSFFIYFLIYFLINWQQLKVKHLLIIICLANLIFIIIPFVTSNDLYSYIFQTRIFPIFAKNPYLVPYDNFQFDILYPFIKTVWSAHTTLHGPLFLLIGGFLNLIARNNLNLTVFLFKITLVGANVLSALFIYLISKNKKALFLYGLNPLIIFELSANVHADSLLILFLLISFYFTKKRKPIKGQLFLTASALVKYSTFMLVPYQFLYIKTKRIKTIFLASLLSILVIIVIYIPFWEGPQIFDYLFTYYNGKFISPSLGIALGEILLNSYKLSFSLNTLIFIIVFIFLGLKLFFSNHKFNQLLFYSSFLYLTYLLTKLSLVLTWDLTPLIALVSLCITWKKYEKFSFLVLLFVSFYSLALYYFVK